VLSGYACHILMVHLTLCLIWVGIYLYLFSNHVLINSSMLIAKSTIKPLHSYLSPHLLRRQVLTLAINNVAQKEEAALKSCEDVAGARRTQPPVDCL
jgi:hypothetical protein